MSTIVNTTANKLARTKGQAKLKICFFIIKSVILNKVSAIKIYDMFLYQALRTKHFRGNKEVQTIQQQGR
jgi:hypothetical protein